QRGDGQPRDRPVSSAVRDPHLRGAVRARPQARDHLSRHHAVRDNLSRGLGADHVHTGPLADRGSLPAGQGLSLRPYRGRKTHMHAINARLAATLIAIVAASVLAATAARAQQFTMKLSQPTINDVVQEYYKAFKAGL